MMRKPVQGVMTALLLLLVGCASAPTSLVEESPAEAPAATEPSGATQVPATTASSDASAEVDTTVVPGERVGPVTPNTTREELATLFGEGNLKDQSVDVGEGQTEKGTVVNQGTDEAFTVLWTDDTRTAIAAITNLGSAWKTPEGIGVGTTFEQLKEQLGTFKLYGLDWDYGGTISFEGSNLSEYDGKLIVRLQPSDNAAEQAPEDYEAVVGDRLFESTDPHFEQLGMKVSDMSVYLGEPAQ
jgi:hypothetical protein